MIIGIIGSGQLSQMMCYSAFNLGIECILLHAPDEAVLPSYATKAYGHDEIQTFFNEADVITVDSENVPLWVLEYCKDKMRPNFKSVFTAQNRFREKTLAHNLGIKTVRFEQILYPQHAANFAKECLEDGSGCIIKQSEQGYDGKGQTKITSTAELSLIDDLDFSREYVGEKIIDFDYEASCILTRSGKGKTVFFPSPVNLHQDGILVKSTLRKFDHEQQIHSLGLKIAEEIDFVGTMCVEFFVQESDSTRNIIFNEIAPRVHNSGHFTQNLCNVSQFENHIRALADMNIVTPELIHKGLMHNLLGYNYDDIYAHHIDNPAAFFHLYGKPNTDIKRKLGHVNIIDNE